MRILLTGRNGQVGWELERKLAPLGELIATDRAALDLADPDAIRRVVREAKPQVIVNAAAYTAVDLAESEPELAMLINGIAPGILADEAKRLGALLVHYSTDYVFDGEKATPYVEDDPPNPLNVYGRTKLAGERAIQAAGGRHLILRTSWVYSLRKANFLLTVIRLARRNARVRIVVDQVGTPTSAGLVAQATVWALGSSSVSEGLFHAAARGMASRHAFATEVVERLGLTCTVEPARTSEFSLPAQRPASSALAPDRLEHSLGVEMPVWREDLMGCLLPVLEGRAALPA